MHELSYVRVIYYYSRKNGNHNYIFKFLIKKNNLFALKWSLYGNRFYVLKSLTLLFVNQMTERGHYKRPMDMCEMIYTK